MRRTLFGLVVGLSVVVICAVQSQSQPAKKAAEAGAPKAKEDAAKPAVDRASDEAAIRVNVAAFVKAYNAGNAKTLAALFTPDGQVEDKEDNVSEGRNAIADTFAGVFKTTPGKQLEVSVESIRFIGADLAVETGTTKETIGPNEPPEYDRYTVVHVKRDGKWLMALARDEEGPVGTNHEHLLPIAWLVGDWVDASATNRLVPTGRESYVWRSLDRVVGDDVQSPIEVKVVRKPPQPKE